jgi:small subunit ribosomal protein S1
VVETRHFRSDDGNVRIGIGEVLDLYVVASGESVVLGPAIRSEGKSEARAALTRLKEAHAAGIPVSGRVTGVNAGGLTVDAQGVRGFCPVSQIESGYCADPSVYVGRTLEFVVTAVEDGRRSVVLSRRQLLRREEEAQSEKALATLKPGDELEGRVMRLEDFGAFVDIGGIDGMVHVSEIRHERIAHPRDALREGEQVRVKVLRIQPGKDGKPRVALSIKAATPDPWNEIEGRFAPGQRIRGVVARLTDFGAFVNVAPGIDGLVHVSEAAPHRIAHVKDVLEQGQEVDAVVLAVDPARRRISLSIRQTVEGEIERPAPREGGRPREGARSREGARPREGSRSRDGSRAREGGRPRDGGGARDSDRDRVVTPAPARVPDEPTTFAIALRKAVEAARLKDQGEPGS